MTSPHITAAMSMNNNAKAEYLGYALVKAGRYTAACNGDDVLCQLTKKELGPWLHRMVVSAMEDAAAPAAEVDAPAEAPAATDEQLSLF